jgi:hypothetical protein
MNPHLNIVQRTTNHDRANLPPSVAPFPARPAVRAAADQARAFRFVVGEGESARPVTQATATGGRIVSFHAALGEPYHHVAPTYLSDRVTALFSDEFGGVA